MSHFFYEHVYHMQHYTHYCIIREKMAIYSYVHLYMRDIPKPQNLPEKHKLRVYLYL